MNSNQHIREFLDFYLGRPESKLKCENADYAVLITGCWGSGKTHFIRNYLGKDDSEIRNWFTDCKDFCVVYVTLFGVKTREEVNQRVFQKICPVLSSEKLEKVVGNIPNLAELAGFVVGLVAGSPTIAVASKKYSKIVGNQLKELSQKAVDDLKKTEKEFKKTIIIFDDVERADMPIPELLGYINEYVEHLKIPCILLAEENIWNEAKIKQKNDSTLYSLSSTEEKVVGKHFLIQTTPEEIINAWFPNDVESKSPIDENDKVCPPSHIFGDNVHELLSPHKDMLINIIKASGVNNYRAFKHTLHDLNNFIGFQYCNISKSFFEKDKDFAKYLLADFLCIQYAKYLDLLKKDFYEIDSHKSTENDGSYKNFKNRFENIDRITSLNYLEDEYKWLPLWKKWLRNGSIDKDEIESKIKDTIWFERKQDDMLPKLYDWYKLSDAEGEKALLYFKEILDEKKLLDPDAIFSLYYKFYWYAEKGALDETPDEFNKKMNEYLDSIKDDIHYQDPSSFGGMDSYEFMTEAFEKNVSEFRNKLKKFVLARKEFFNVDETNYFNVQMKSENDLNFNLLCKKIENRNSYNLEKIKEKDFVESFVSLKNIGRKNRFRAALEARYAGVYLAESQKSFLMGILNCANNLWNDYKANKTLTPSQFSLYYLKKTIIKILAKQDSFVMNTGNQVSFTQRCSKCGSFYSVVVSQEPGKNEPEEYYNCPVCNTKRHVRTSLPPSVRLIAKL